MKILIVDDDVICRKALKKITIPLGETRVADSGAAAIEYFIEAWDDGLPFDLILLDIIMGDIDGIQVLNKIREIEKEKSIPKAKKCNVIMVTSKTEKEIVMSSIHAGCSGYIVKPINKEKLYEKLEHLGYQIDRQLEKNEY